MHLLNNTRNLFKIKCLFQNSRNNLINRGLNGINGNNYSLPDLPYDYNALEPVISAEIMTLHHTKHHMTYVNNLNIALEKFYEAKHKNDISSMISLEPMLRFNGGGHINHSIFWQNLSPKGGGEPEGDLLLEIKESFSTFDNFKNQMCVQASGVQGSGWAWLGFCPKSQKLRIATCANQDPLQAITGLVPLFGIDVWEHAYYLQYKNVRPDYVKAIWNVINWKDVEQRLTDAKAL